MAKLNKYCPLVVVELSAIEHLGVVQKTMLVAILDLEHEHAL